jgi:hypothetical protein
MVWELAGDLVGLLRGARQIHACPADQAAFREQHRALRFGEHDQFKIRTAQKKANYFSLRLNRRRVKMVLAGRWFGFPC